MKMIVVYVASDSHRNVRHIVVLIWLVMLRNTRLKDISRLLLMQSEWNLDLIDLAFWTVLFYDLVFPMISLIYTAYCCPTWQVIKRI